MTRTRRIASAALTLLMAAALAIVAAPDADAGNPHFVSVNVERVGDTLEVEGKEAGLGNEDQVHIVVSALVECVNRGGNKPSADNKQAVSVEGTFPVQNGHADFFLVLDGAAQISPSCSPPMSIVYSDVTVTDVTHDVVYEVEGTF